MSRNFVFTVFYKKKEKKMKIEIGLLCSDMVEEAKRLLRGYNGVGSEYDIGYYNSINYVKENVKKSTSITYRELQDLMYEYILGRKNVGAEYRRGVRDGFRKMREINM